MDGFIICTPTGDDFGVKGSRCGDRSDVSDMNYAFVVLSSSGVALKKQMILNAAIAPYLLKIYMTECCNVKYRCRISGYFE